MKTSASHDEDRQALRRSLGGTGGMEEASLCAAVIDHRIPADSCRTGR